MSKLKLDDYIVPEWIQKTIEKCNQSAMKNTYDIYGNVINRIMLHDDDLEKPFWHDGDYEDDSDNVNIDDLFLLREEIEE